jgi:hypothetical protein
MTLNSYTHQPYCELPECFAGWMARDKAASGEIYEPKTVVDRVDLTADSTIAIPLIIEIVERIDERYQYGVGLNATIACDNITGDVIEKWIEEFYARGEVVRKGEKFIVTKEMLDKWNYYKK